MHFKKLELHGFKSFAEPVAFDFTEGMTCIVGPNGSGKSNIADAIKWVLGEQSAKNLRGGKMEEVIFAGTENRKARGIAEVTLVIDNQDQTLPLEYNEIAVTRKMYRSGESEYFINDRPCRMRDIKELIMDTGIGVEGYSLISQGKISEIVNNKAEGRRQLFEEAAGIVKYRTRKREAQRKLENSTSNLDRVNDIISEIEGRIDGLKTDSEKAVEYRQLAENYRRLEINLAVRQAEALTKKLEDLSSELEACEKETESLRADKEKNSQLLISSREKENENERLSAELNSQLMELLSQIAEYKNDIRLSEEKLTAFSRDTSRLERELLRINREILEEEASLEAFEERKSSLSARKSQEEEALAEYEERFLNASSELRKHQDDIEEKKSEVIRLHSGISVGRTEISGLRQLIDGLEKRRSKIFEDMEDSAEILETIRHKSLETDNEIKELSDSINTTADKRKALEQKVFSVNSELADLRRAAEAGRSELHKYETKKELLLGFESSYEGYAQAVRFIMSRKDSLKGITGVISDLMEVPSGFENAIQTALAGNLQNIVCEDDSSASQAVELLKRERAGRATFLPVKSIYGGKSAAESKDAHSIRAEAGFMGFGTEAVSYDNEYSEIINYLLGKTVITDNLDTAVRLSKKYRSGVRFVTLEGELINPSGAISGGRFKKEATNVFERKNEIRALESNISEKSRGVTEIKALIEKKIEELAEAEAGLMAVKAVQREAEDSLHALNNKKQMNGERAAAIKANLNRWEKEKADIVREVSETEAMISGIEAELSSKAGEIAINEGNMDEALKAVESAQQKSDELLDKINRLKLSSYSIDTELKHIEISKQNSCFAIKKLRNELGINEEEALRIKESTAEAEEVIACSQNALQDAVKKQSELEAAAAECRDEKERASALRAECEELAADIDKKLLDAGGRVSEVQIKAAKSETQLESLKNNLWDTFEVSFIEAQALREEPFAVTSAQRESRETRLRMKELEPVNLGAIEEYQRVSERYGFLTEQRKDLNEAIASLTDIISDMDKLITVRFNESFEEIRRVYKETFTELFGGGSAELKLEDSENVLESTIEIIAQPPGKKLQNINLLSGGEKSLAAIALLCSILKVKPAPFCILDEVEAALDENNVGRFAEYIRSFENIQFIVVTHQKMTMEKADTLYGITMPEKGISKVVSLRLPDNNQ